MARGQQELLQTPFAQQHNLAERLGAPNVKGFSEQMTIQEKFELCFEVFKTSVADNTIVLNDQGFREFLNAVQAIFDLSIEDQEHFLAMFRLKILDEYVVKK